MGYVLQRVPSKRMKMIHLCNLFQAILMPLNVSNDWNFHWNRSHRHDEFVIREFRFEAYFQQWWVLLHMLCACSAWYRCSSAVDSLQENAWRFRCKQHRFHIRLMILNWTNSQQRPISSDPRSLMNAVRNSMKSFLMQEISVPRSNRRVWALANVIGMVAIHWSCYQLIWRESKSDPSTLRY